MSRIYTSFQRGTQVALFSACVVMASGCATSGGDAHPREFTSGKVNTSVDANAASAVFLRAPDAVAGQAVNIFINGEYLTSLTPGGFQQGPACVGSNRLTASYTDVSTRYLEKERQGQSFATPAGQVSYFQVVGDAAGKPVLQQLDATAGQALADQLKQQGHTLPRVQLKCAVPLKTYTLQASALFPFDKSDYASMLPQGKEEIRKVAQDIAASKANVDRIEVVGHTDPEGSDMYNQALSQRRADTVRMALSQSQLPGSQIVAHGRGEKQLLVSDCRARFPRDAKQRMACDQPNRRVEITLYGTQQAAQPAAN